MSIRHVGGFENTAYKYFCNHGNYLIKSESYTKDIIYKLYNKKHHQMCSFQENALPGCCGVLVIYYIRPNEINENKNKKTFKFMIKIFEKIAAELKVGLLQFSQVNNSIGYDVLIKERGYNIINFVNGKTNNEICLFQKVIIKEKLIYKITSEE